jgi:hypothetical protein
MSILVSEVMNVAIVLNWRKRSETALRLVRVHKRTHKEAHAPVTYEPSLDTPLASCKTAGHCVVRLQLFEKTIKYLCPLDAIN